MPEPARSDSATSRSAVNLPSLVAALDDMRLARAGAQSRATCLASDHVPILCGKRRHTAVGSEPRRRGNGGDLPAGG